jgi:uncharacterized membrane protein
VTRWRPVATTLVCVVGLGLAAYLTWAHYFDQASINSSCPLGGGGSSFINCGKVTSSSQSMIFGLPVALYGLLYFVGMTALCLPRSWRSPSVWLARARLAGVVAGMGFVLYLVSVEFLQLHALCLYCTGEHLLQFALFLLVTTGWYDTGYAQLRYASDDDDLADGEDPAGPQPGQPDSRAHRRHSSAVSR